MSGVVRMVGPLRDGLIIRCLTDSEESQVPFFHA